MKKLYFILDNCGFMFHCSEWELQAITVRNPTVNRRGVQRQCATSTEWTCEHLSFCEKCGFPCNGRLSLNQIEKLGQQLEEVEKRKGNKRGVVLKAFVMWKAEAIVRDNQKSRLENVLRSQQGKLTGAWTFQGS